jgi:hypothetical protein
LDNPGLCPGPADELRRGGQDPDADDQGEDQQRQSRSKELERDAQAEDWK